MTAILILSGAGSLSLWLIVQALTSRRRPRLIERMERNQVTELSVEPVRYQISERIRARFASKARNRTALYELPDILDLIAVALSAGDNLFAAIARVAPRARGVVARELQAAIAALELGSTLNHELDQLAKRLPERQVIEFCNKLILSLQRGTPLANLLQEQAQSARAEVHNRLLKAAGQNETKMLVPLVFLILPVTVLFAIYPSLQMLNLNF